MGREFKAYKPETITRMLANLRAQIIRDGGDGLEHVEALLAMRGHNLGPVPRKAPPANFRRGKLRVAIFAALRDGSLAGPDIVRCVAERHGLAYSVVYRSVYAQLHCIKKAGLVETADGLWRVAD